MPVLDFEMFVSCVSCDFNRYEMDSGTGIRY